MKIPFLGGAYAGRSSNVNAERCLNFYLEAGPPKPSLVGTPGLTLRLTLDEGPIRGMKGFGNHLYAVAGSKVYRIDSSHTATSLGSIGASTSRVSTAANNSNLLIVDGSSSGYHTDGATLTTISDSDFNGGTSATYQDGYFIVTEPQSGIFRISDLNSVDWITTDFATAEGNPDGLRAGISSARELWLLGEKTTEVWWNSGNADFPFERIQAGFVQRGIASHHAVSLLDNSLAWISADERGHPMALHAVDGYQPQVISPANINWQWSQYSTWSDVFTYTYQLEGHEFWVVTFPTANRTWVYDATTKQWHQWSSNLDDDPLSRHRSNCHSYTFNRHYVGDYASGKIYTIEPEVYTEDGATIIRDRITQNGDTAEDRISLSQVQVSFEEGVGLISGQGSNPTAMLRWSKDGGHRWSNERWRSIGRIGEYGIRAVWRKLGVARIWTFWLRVSDPVKWVITDASARLRYQDKEPE